MGAVKAKGLRGWAEERKLRARRGTGGCATWGVASVSGEVRPSEPDLSDPRAGGGATRPGEQPWR